MSRPKSLKQSLPGLRRTLAYFWPYVGKEKKLLFISSFAMIFEVGFKLLEPWPLKFIFDRVIVDSANSWQTGFVFIDNLDSQTLLIASAVVLVLATSLRALSAYHKTIGFALIGNRVLTEIRGKLYNHLQRLSLNFHHKSKDGDVVVRMISDIGMLKEVAVTAFLPLVGDCLVLVGMLVIMFFVQWQLALLSLIIFPLFLISSQRLGKRIQDVSRKQRQQEGMMAATAAESIGAIKTVQALSLEKHFAESFSSQNKKSLKDGVKAKRLQAQLERTVDILTAIATALVVYMGARFIKAGSLTPGDLIVFMAYLKSAFKPLKNLAKYTGRLAKASAAGERVLELFEQKVSIQNRLYARRAPALSGDIRFEDVSFSYDNGETVLKNLNLHIRAGESIAFVGDSGQGKSTLLSLIPRLYDPSEGRILIDGIDIRDYTYESLRAQMSVVLQDSLLFAISVKDNITLGTQNASRDDILQATLLANAHDFIMRLPEAYNTILAERGTSLSGGQRQRIAVARAALRNSPILILDEPTTGLDETSEQLIIKALRQLSKGKTTLIATHDLAFAAQADRIIYLENGRVLEQGSHMNLMYFNGRYAELYISQQGEQYANAS